jgi:RNA polymerase sigma-54 factor
MRLRKTLKRGKCILAKALCWHENRAWSIGNWKGAESGPYASYGDNLDPDYDPFANIAAQDESIYQELESQIRLSGWPDAIKDEVRHLIPYLDGHGFLPEENPFLDWTDEQYEDAVLQMQRLEPIGIGARTVEESLLLQSAARGFPELVDQIVLGHLEDVASGQFGKIASRLKCTEEELRSAVQQMRSLSPYPVNIEAVGVTAYVRPDVVVVKRNGKYEVDGALPANRRPKIVETIEKLLRDPSLNAEQKKQLRAQRKKAQTLLKFCDMRDDTIIRVANILCRQQHEFLEQGPTGKKPLTLKDVAKELEVHESTISRTVAGKSVLTDRGLILMRNFFDRGMSDSQGSEMVGDAVRETLKEVLDLEAKERWEKPFSDEELAAELTKRGMKVARRTVAKYRGIMGIAPKGERKRQYKLREFTEVKS